MQSEWKVVIAEAFTLASIVEIEERLTVLRDESDTGESDDLVLDFQESIPTRTRSQFSMEEGNKHEKASAAT